MTSIPDLPAKVTLASSLCHRQIADRDHGDRPVLLGHAHVLALPPAQEPVPVAEAPRVDEGGAAPAGVFTNDVNTRAGGGGDIV